MAKMSPQDRLKLRNFNLESPPEDSMEVGGHSPFSLQDIADTPMAKCDPVAANDSEAEELADMFSLSISQATRLLAWHHAEIESATRREKANYLQIIVGGLLASKNPKLNSAGLAFAANLAALNGLPCQREYARQNHISASAISKVVRSWQRSLDLNPSAHQKSEHACKVYAHVGKTRHWRNKKVKAATATELLQRLQKKSKPSCN
jgi:hypothetical protein